VRDGLLQFVTTDRIEDSSSLFPRNGFLANQIQNRSLVVGESYDFFSRWCDAWGAVGAGAKNAYGIGDGRRPVGVSGAVGDSAVPGRLLRAIAVVLLLRQRVLSP
jgi:hypothetical protein